MSDFGKWLEKGVLTAASKAAIQWSRIQEKPTAITFLTPAGATLASQVVRLENDSIAMVKEGGSGLGASRKLYIMGVVDHETVTDTDIEEGYRFVLDNDEYRVTDVLLTIGQKQGYAEHNG